MSTNQIDFIKQKINFTRVQRTTVNRTIDPFYSNPKNKLTCLSTCGSYLVFGQSSLKRVYVEKTTAHTPIIKRAKPYILKGNMYLKLRQQRLR